MPAPKSEASERCDCGRCHAHATGQFGPYSPRQFTELFGVVNEPAPVEVDPALAALGIEVDAALERYDQAKAVWLAALGEKGGHDAGAARGLLDVENDRLRAARAAYNALARSLSDHRIAEEYAAARAEQAAQREARRAATAATPGMLRRLARIRPKVAG